ncbi:MAG TPA: Flp family type IVb pilin [Nitrospiraceae bacterium]|nr:Flp family type IVb pilin [Nitrospiraceae bacterium]
MLTLREICERASSRFFGILKSERGQTLVEYGLLLVMIAIFVILMLKGSGEQVNTLYSKINSGLSNP